MPAAEPERTSALTSLPTVEDLPRSGKGYDAAKVEEAFAAFRRHAAQLQAQLRVLQAASPGPQGSVDPTGHAVRMDALHLIRAASEFADTVEQDAQRASAAQLAKTEEEVRRRQRALQQDEAELDRFRQESERERAAMLSKARKETRELLAKAHREATQELHEAEIRGDRLLEQARHQATELTNAARAEVEQTLEWARAQAGTILGRAQNGAEQLLAAAGLGEDEIRHVAEAIVKAAQEMMEAARTPAQGRTAVSTATEQRPAETADADDEGTTPAPQVEDIPPTPALAEAAVSAPAGAEAAAETGGGDSDQKSP